MLPLPDTWNGSLGSPSEVFKYVLRNALFDIVFGYQSAERCLAKREHYKKSINYARRRPTTPGQARYDAYETIKHINKNAKAHTTLTKHQVTSKTLERTSRPQYLGFRSNARKRQHQRKLFTKESKASQVLHSSTSLVGITLCLQVCDPFPTPG